MGQYDYLTEPTAPSVSGTDIVINPGQQQPSQGTRFLSTFMSGLMKGAGQEDKVKKERDKLTYYTELRKAGYSPDEASKRVNKQMSGGFLNKVLGKSDAGFTPPAGASDYVTDEQEKKAKLERTQAQTGYLKNKMEAEAKGKDPGTSSKAIQEKVKNLGHRLDNILGMIDESKDPKRTKQLERQRDAIQKALDKFEGVDYEDDAGEDEASDPNKTIGNTQSGQPGKSGGFYMIRVKRKSDGQTGLLNQDEFNAEEYERIA